MNTIRLFLFKARKALYLILEAVQSFLLPIEMRTGKYFDDGAEGLGRWGGQSYVKSSEYRVLLESIDSKGIFIVGAGRSGTTILRRVLNSSPEIMMWHEANLYINLNNPNFRGNFNLQHKDKDQEKKATFINEPVFEELNSLQTLGRVGKSYTLAGEKLVFLANNKPDAFFNFHTKYFLNSVYFFTLRNPAEVVWSMTKMFPEENIHKFILIWLKSAEIALRSLGTFEKSYLIFQ